MVTVDVQTWVSLAALAGFALALFGYLGAMKRDLVGQISGVRGELKSEIGGLRTELKGDISELRAELKSEIGEVRADLRVLNQRTYDMSTRLPAAPAQSAG